MKYAEVIIPLSVRKTFRYSIPKEFEKECKIGIRVLVQFGSKKFYTAIIKKIDDKKPRYKTKKIYTLIDKRPVITELHLKFWEWISKYYMANIGDVYTAAMPVSLRIESQTQVTLSKTIINDKLSKNENRVVEQLKKQKTLTIGQITKIIDVKNPLNIVNKLIKKEIVDVYEHFNRSYKPKYEKYVKLSPLIKTEKDLDDVFDKISRAKKQTEILLSYIVISELKFIEKNFIFKEVKKKDLLKKAKSSYSVLNSLYKKNILIEYEKQISRLKDYSNKKVSFKKLTEIQKKVLENIKKNFKKQNIMLLYGVTSSGKTEVYIELIKYYLKKNKQILYLLPEIALTTQIISRLRAAFGDIVGVYHSKFSDSERAEIWAKINPTKEIKPYKIILGVRSAIFLPFNNLGLIIVDEEHETTYKQFNPSPRYHARDSAIVLAKLHNAKVLLGTATPSVESYYNAKNKKYGYTELTKRYGDVKLPEVIIADLRAARKENKMKSIFHPLLLENIKEALGNGEQIILFQNRRGFSPYLECNTCGWIPKCVNCDVNLTYHIQTNNLVCHYCGYKKNVPKKCENCGSISIETRGFGTQKVEDEIKIFFPEAKVARLDLDAAKRKHGYELTLDAFDKGQTDILVGTQMVTKGLDFENVRVVGILNADNLLNFPDFRSYERSFQLMTQVSGRAGRFSGKGKVIIQTNSTNHKILKYVLENNFNSFFEEEIIERKNFKYPPFIRIIKISIKHKKENICYDFALKYSKILKKIFGLRILGPQEPIIKRIQNYFIREILIKLDAEISLKKAKIAILNNADKLKMFKNYSNVQVIFNVDPF